MKRQAFFLAPARPQSGIGPGPRQHGEIAPPTGIEAVLPGLGHLVLGHQLGIVDDAVFAEPGGDEIVARADQRRVHLGVELRPRHRKDDPRLDVLFPQFARDVDQVVTDDTGDGFVEDALAAGQPADARDLDLEAVFLLEGLGQRLAQFLAPGDGDPHHRFCLGALGEILDGLADLRGTGGGAHGAGHEDQGANGTDQSFGQTCHLVLPCLSGWHLDYLHRAVSTGRKLIPPPSVTRFSPFAEPWIPGAPVCRPLGATGRRRPSRSRHLPDRGTTVFNGAKGGPKPARRRRTGGRARGIRAKPMEGRGRREEHNVHRRETWQ